ncbi:uncharacterized protein KY384_007858 [Bacidia gigantensis]|uniref:uncharacterized protein n=1 Tax=Bacidia gigantensis TaxID=2732470 RepID=UPI001D05A00E|nr:uncharacterized protein KY384_007858 [Bacidia gigantensis]KAG8527704.1 hypothetical protein KY384_007858 [Bacidia gigantensis]
MNPFLSIPEMYEEEMRELIREREGLDDKTGPRKAPRVNTVTLLFPEHGSEEKTGALKPEETLEQYHNERLQQGLKYVTTEAKTDIIPRTRVFLEIAQCAYQVALQTKTRSACAVVQAMDSAYYYRPCFFKAASPQDNECLSLELKLRRLELSVNYLDYSNQDDSPHDLKNRLYINCDILGIDPNHMRELINEYNKRNVNLGSQTAEHITNCYWTDLAIQLSRDLNELLNVCSDRATAEKYEEIILGIQAEYFEDIRGFPDPRHWWPNGKARMLTTERYGIEGQNDNQ